MKNYKLLPGFNLVNNCVKSARLKSNNQWMNLIPCSFFVKKKKNVCGFQGFKFLVYSGSLLHSEDFKYKRNEKNSCFTVFIKNMVHIMSCCLWFSTTHLLLWHHPSSSVTLGREVSMKQMMWTKPFFFKDTSSTMQGHFQCESRTGWSLYLCCAHHLQKIPLNIPSL